jgi:hypothetical protein
MRAVVVLHVHVAATLAATMILAACAGEKLAASPPAGVDLSGQWNLNVADSDDPLRIVQALSSNAAAGSGNASGGGGQGGGGRRGRGGSSQGGGGSATGAPGGGTVPVAAVSEALRWPGRNLEIKQAGGVVTFKSDGAAQVYRPARSKGDQEQVVGWSESSLVVTLESEDGKTPIEERYSLSDDRQRLFELVTLKSARMNGFSMSRVWDRGP